MRWPLQPLQPFQQTQLQPPFGQSVASLCHPWFTTTNFSYRFPILKLPPPPCAVLLVYLRRLVGNLRRLVGNLCRFSFLVEVFKLDTWVMCSWCGESLHHTCGIERIPFHSKHHNLLEPSKIQKLPSHQKSSVWGLAPPKVHFSSNINNYCRLVCSIWNITVMTPIFLWVEPCLDHAPVTVKLMAQWLPIKHPQSKYVRWNPPTYCGSWINAMGSGKQSHTSTGKLGNRLTRRPCKGDEFEIPIFEAKRQNAGICNMDIHFDWQACDSRVEICVSPARWLDFALQGSKKKH